MEKLENRKSSNFLGLGWITLGLVAAGIGTYFLHPKKGQARRSALRNKLFRFGSSRHSLMVQPTQSEDRKLMEQIRLEMGPLVRHPAEVEVIVQHGNVRLNGPVDASEVEPLMTLVRRIATVHNIENNLQVIRNLPEDQAYAAGQ